MREATEMGELPNRRDELAERRLAKLDLVKAMMAANLKPDYGGFYGQLQLASDAVAELGELAEVRKAARAAGHQLGWKVRTHVSEDGTLLVMDERDAPEEIQMLAARRAAEATAALLTSAQNEAHMCHTSQPTFPGQPKDPGQDL
ncbi:hypothetical protein ACFWYW_27335 [Nonomuraea sp. NPDC059023]|uniref:hypothetical protein n=1 Tax=unclassified Nonomuraea TaxID=2593643 RepID=UPI0036BEDDE4